MTNIYINNAPRTSYRRLPDSGILDDLPVTAWRKSSMPSIRPNCSAESRRPSDICGIASKGRSAVRLGNRIYEVSRPRAPIVNPDEAG